MGLETGKVKMLTIREAQLQGWELMLPIQRSVAIPGATLMRRKRSDGFFQLGLAIDEEYDER